MGWLLPALQLAGSVYGSINQRNAQKAASSAAQDAENRSAGISNELLQMIQGISNNNAQFYQNELPGLSALFGNELKGAGSQVPGAASTYLNEAMSPAALAAASGVDAGGLTRAATDYLSHPGDTNLAQAAPGALSTLANPNTNLAGVSPALQQFFQKEMTHGIDPTFAQNAQNQVGQNYTQSVNDLKATARPGQNLFAQERDLNDNMLKNSANLGGQLAGESQQFANQGAEGVASTAGNLDQQNFGRIAQLLQSAGLIDSQTASMLTGGAELGNNYNQTVLGNAASGAGFGQNLLQQIMGFIGQGNQTQESAMNALGGLAGMFNGNAANAASIAGNAPQSNPFASLFQMFANMQQGTNYPSPQQIAGSIGNIPQTTPPNPGVPGVTTGAPGVYVNGTPGKTAGLTKSYDGPGTAGGVTTGPPRTLDGPAPGTTTGPTISPLDGAPGVRGGPTITPLGTPGVSGRPTITPVGGTGFDLTKIFPNLLTGGLNFHGFNPTNGLVGAR